MTSLVRIATFTTTPDIHTRQHLACLPFRSTTTTSTTSPDIAHASSQPIHYQISSHPTSPSPVTITNPDHQKANKQCPPPHRQQPLKRATTQPLPQPTPTRFSAPHRRQSACSCSPSAASSRRRRRARLLGKLYRRRRGMGMGMGIITIIMGMIITTMIVIMETKRM